MRGVMNIKNLIAIFVLFSLIVATSAFAEEKYQDVFYPNGMPEKEGVYGEGPTVYNLYSELKIPDTNLIVVVFSENIIVGEYSNNDYTVFISILESNIDGSFRIKCVKDITDYLKLSMEEGPGSFLTMTANLNFFKISKDLNAVHLSMDNILAGSGGLDGESDVIFLIKDNQLVPVLELVEDGSGGRAGASHSSFSHTFIYLANVDSNGSVDIITQGYEYYSDQHEGVFKSELSPKLKVYKYNYKENKYKLNGKRTSLPKHAINLKQTIMPNVKALTKHGLDSN